MYRTVTSAEPRHRRRRRPDDVCRPNPDHCGTPPDCGTIGAALTIPLTPPIPQGHFGIGYTPLRDLHQRVEWAGPQAGEASQQLALQAQACLTAWYSSPSTLTSRGTPTSLTRCPAVWTNTKGPSMATTSTKPPAGPLRPHGETTLAFGTSYDDVLHLGLSGLTSIDMEQVDVYSERNKWGHPLDRFTFNDRLEVSGSGAFWAFGLILQPENTPLRWELLRLRLLHRRLLQVDATSDFSDGTGYEWNSPNSYVNTAQRPVNTDWVSWTMGKPPC